MCFERGMFMTEETQLFYPPKTMYEMVEDMVHQNPDAPAYEFYKVRIRSTRGKLQTSEERNGEREFTSVGTKIQHHQGIRSSQLDL